MVRVDGRGGGRTIVAEASTTFPPASAPSSLNDNVLRVSAHAAGHLGTSGSSEPVVSALRKVLAGAYSAVHGGVSTR